jgi:hypothetical protein
MLVLALVMGSAQLALASGENRAPAETGGWVAPDANAKHTWIYVAGSSGKVIDIYDLDRIGTPRIGKITQGLNNPAMMAVDASGTLYVPNYNFARPGGNVTIYPPGATVPSLTLSQGLSEPISVAVDSNKNVYVSNRGSVPSIVVFPPGSTVPSATITSTMFGYPANVIFDSANNLYIADEDNGVLELPSGSSEPISLGLTGFTGAIGLALDSRTGNLFVSTVGSKVLVYAPGGTEPLRTLDVSTYACVLASGSIHRGEYIFVPDCSSDSVWLFNTTKDHPVTVFDFKGAGSACCIGIKPAGIP